MALVQSSKSVELQARKRAHLDLCEHEVVEYRGKSTLLEEVELLHNALPELADEDLEISTPFLGKMLKAPFLITAMTGGTGDGFAVNRDLALVAERCGVGIGLGSQRAMRDSPGVAWTFDVRKYAPTTVLLANIGIVQAATLSARDVRGLVASVGADGLCVHLNPAQEMTQAEGDRSFRGGEETLRRLVAELEVPVIVKETGCGISRAAAAAIMGAGVRYLDVSGAGGTSWVRVETLRGNECSRRRGMMLSDWGIPTAASLAMLRDSGLELIASGGLRSGLDMAKALALGASLCGAALPIYRRYRAAGIEGAVELIAELVDGLKTAMLLTGSRTLRDLTFQPVVLGEHLRAWIAADTWSRGFAGVLR